MRVLLVAVLAALVACGGGNDPNQPVLVSFTYAENLQPTAGSPLFDSVGVAARVIDVYRQAYGNLCGSTLTSGVAPAGMEVTMNVIQNPVRTCQASPALLSYRGTIQLNPGQYHLRVVERMGANPNGAVVIDRTLVVPAVD
ncbi:MAG: hypothetical protein U0163_15060 [Gemmatimonadaceae bacterium]